MAGYSCDSDHDTAADILITNLAGGEVAAYCSACAPAIMRAMADAMDPEPQPAPVAAAETAATPNGEGGAAQAPPGRKRARSGSTAAQTGPIPGEAPDARPPDGDS